MSLVEQGAESLIFDLRGNGGGLLDSAVDISSQFLSDGVVLREDRRNEGERVYDVRGGGHALDQPLVVLVNGGTASASENCGRGLAGLWSSHLDWGEDVW